MVFFQQQSLPQRAQRHRGKIDNLLSKLAEYENILWVHNDSGDSARVYALNPDGRMYARCTLTGASATDWEDMAIGIDPVSGDDYLYVGDIGDNASVRSEISVYRVPEPDLDTNAFNVVTNLTGVERYRFVYPDGARDAETLLFDPWTGDLYILSKRDAKNRIYRAPYPQDTNAVTTLTYLDEIPLTWTVAGDISPSGYQILIKQYGAMNYYVRSSVFSAADVSYSNQILSFEWNAVTGRIYEIQQVQGPLTNDCIFTPLVTNISVATDQVIRTNLSIVAESGFYRLCVVPQ